MASSVGVGICDWLRVGVCLLLLLLLCGGVAAAQDSFVVNAEVVGVDTRSNAAYLRVNVRNLAVKATPYTITFDRYNGPVVTLQGADLAPGKSTVHHVLIPFMPYNGRITGNDSGFSITSYEYKPFLRISEPHDALTPEEIAQFTISLQAGSATYTSATLPQRERQLENVTVELLPIDWKCYVPFQRVFVNANAWRQLNEAKRDALESWVMTGGRLTVYDAADEATRALGGGVISTVKMDPVRLAAQIAPAEFHVGRERFVEQGGSPFEGRARPALAGTAVLLVLFFLVVGPINYFYHSRKNRIRALLFTTPMVSLVFCFIITGYFIVSQGFKRQGGTAALTVLDEASGRMARWSKHTFFSGLYPLGGFKFGPSTVLLAQESRGSSLADVTNGLHFKSGFYAPNTELVYATLSAGKMRERLVFDESGMKVTNGFEQPIAKLLVARGGEVFSAEKIRSGSEAALKPMTAGAALARGGQDPLLLMAVDGATDGADIYNLWSGDIGDTFSSQGDRYVILFEGKPRWNDAGVEFTDGQNLHVLVGLMTNAEEPNAAAAADLPGGER